MVMTFGKCEKCGKTQFLCHTNNGRICAECKRKYGIYGAFGGGESIIDKLIGGGESIIDKLKRLLKDKKR